MFRILRTANTAAAAGARAEEGASTGGAAIT